jgi:hypothetical protein
MRLPLVSSCGWTRNEKVGQREFDDLVSGIHPVTAQVGGDIMRVTSVDLKRVP